MYYAETKLCWMFLAVVEAATSDCCLRPSEEGEAQIAREKKGEEEKWPRKKEGEEGRRHFHSHTQEKKGNIFFDGDSLQSSE